MTMIHWHKTVELEAKMPMIDSNTILDKNEIFQELFRVFISIPETLANKKGILFEITLNAVDPLVIGPLDFFEIEELLVDYLITVLPAIAKTGFIAKCASDDLNLTVIKTMLLVRNLGVDHFVKIVTSYSKENRELLAYETVFRIDEKAYEQPVPFFWLPYLDLFIKPFIFEVQLIIKFNDDQHKTFLITCHTDNMIDFNEEFAEIIGKVIEYDHTFLNQFIKSFEFRIYLPDLDQQHSFFKNELKLV